MDGSHITCHMQYEHVLFAFVLLLYIGMSLSANVQWWLLGELVGSVISRQLLHAIGRGGILLLLYCCHLMAYIGMFLLEDED